jgi:hypothetical protein
MENARSITNAVRKELHKQTAIPASTTMQNVLLERLEVKLLANEVECTNVQASKASQGRKARNLCAGVASPCL